MRSSMKLPSLKEGVKAVNPDLDPAILPQMIINRCGATSKANLIDTSKDVVKITEEERMSEVTEKTRANAGKPTPPLHYKALKEAWPGLPEVEDA